MFKEANRSPFSNNKRANALKEATVKKADTLADRDGGKERTLPPGIWKVGAVQRAEHTHGGGGGCVCGDRA
jgi:hypothetical protein